MADPCARRSTLTRAGLTQAGRRLRELKRDYFRPDERDLADLVMFGQRFARHLKYYQLPPPDAVVAGTSDGDWSQFFESDVTAALAALTRLPVDPFRQFQADLEQWLLTPPPLTGTLAGTHFKLWFHLPLTLLQLAGRHHASLPPDHALAQSLRRLVARDLAAPLLQIAGWHKGAVAQSLFTGTAPVGADYNLHRLPDARVRVPDIVADAVLSGEAFAEVGIAPTLLAELPTRFWPHLYAQSTADPTPFIQPGTAIERIEDALNYNLLRRAVERIMQALLRVRQDAEAALAESVDGFAAHPAHYGLWLAFLKMFRLAQDQMNAFTGRHLDFYLGEVLRLRPGAAVPDHAHLTFQLAKGTERHLLAKGTAFRAGKDALGHPVQFRLDSDLVVNRASVAQLAGMRFEAGVVAGRPTLLPRASPVVQSADGIGEVALPEARLTFPPFGPALAPLARIGFAIADRRLFLREGQRSIVLRVEMQEALDLALSPRFRVRLSGAAGWFEAGSVVVRQSNDLAEITPPGGAGSADTAKDAEDEKGDPFNFTTSAGKEPVYEGKDDGGKPGVKTYDRRISGIEITIELAPADPAVIPLNPKLHGSEHDPGLPVAELILDFADGTTAQAYANLRDAKLDGMSVQVSASGLRQLTLLAAGAPADAAKPFAPFGPRPRFGDSLIIGSSEIFSKPLAALTLSPRWKTTYSEWNFYRNTEAVWIRATEAVLEDGKWWGYDSDDDRSDRQLALGQGDAAVGLLSMNLVTGRAEQTIENPNYAATAVAGFLKLQLLEDFGHDEQPTEMARAMIDLARGVNHTPKPGVNYEPAATVPTRGILPRQPYDPVWTGIEASYVSTRAQVARMDLLGPFGLARASTRLLPELDFAAALYIGIADFAPPGRLTLLIQVEDGSGDPLLPVQGLKFAWLDGDSFVDFEDQDVDDKTLNLTTSGVLGLALPARRTSAHRVMPDGLTWLRIAAPRYPDALNRLRAVTAQAGRVTFADRGNDPSRLAAALPPGSIAKTEDPDPAIKLVVQPFDGFGGRPVETPPDMDVRVAERLRHKDRAITMWDTEALVLGAFPALNRVKCLGLTELRRDTAGVVVADNEQKPGAVSVVAVPQILPGSARDPLRPYVDQATLKAVERFLRPRFSPFVRLEVTNPRIEEIHLDFSVRFAPGIADFAFYIDALNAALVGYLTPWAVPGGGEITFGGRLWRSRVIDFLDGRPEVDFVTEVKMYHKIDVTAADGDWTPIPVEVVEATSARSILVSAARHRIVELPS